MDFGDFFESGEDDSADEPQVLASNEPSMDESDSSNYGLTDEEAKLIKDKNLTGTWLSPLAQPNPAPGHLPIRNSPPTDAQHRRYVAGCAEASSYLNSENLENYGEKLAQTFRRYPLEVRDKKPTRWTPPNDLERSTKNSPISIPISIDPKSTTPLQTFDSSRSQITGSLRYTWQEDIVIHFGRLEQRDRVTIQVRHHTKLETAHEICRPVYCINLKSDDSQLIDLRLVAILNLELPFLEAAAQHFKKPCDSYEGLPVYDHLGRVWIDERIIRRAAFHYAQYQQILISDSESKPALYEPSSALTDTVRLAHFLVQRSHLPELEFNSSKRCFQYVLQGLPKVPENAKIDFKELLK